ncbi:MAG TPA: serine/threonine-protein kinase [Polyangia bacterium]|nr:serine/threonine-protein kinase [Polyangia bacterium]
MPVGRGGVAAVLGVSALGAAAAAFLAAGSSDARRAAAISASGRALAAAQAAVASSARDLAVEAVSAAAVPQFRAALQNKVDTFTLDDLFQTEDWWAPHRARAFVLMGPDGVVMSRNVRSDAPAAAELATRAAGHDSMPLARVGEQTYLVAAGPVRLADPPGRVVVLGLPVDGPLVESWAASAHAGVLVTDGHGFERAGGAPRPSSPADLVGREADPVVVDPGGVWAAASAELGQGLRLWAVSPLAPNAGRAALLPLWGLAAALALVAFYLGLSRRRAPAAAATAGTSVPSTAPTPALMAGSSIASAVPPLARRLSVNLPTTIASGDAQVFGRYTVLGRLGSGGMCDIYTAALTGPEGFQRTFVLKRLKPELALNRAAVDQFIDEAKLGSTLVHSNIVPVFDFGRVGDGFFIAQEYIVGRNIAQLCERHQERLSEPLDVATVFYIAYETLQALGYAHDKTNDAGEPMHIVHRDISPGNVVVSRVGEVKLIDFGIVKSADSSRVSHTDLGNVKGNAAFMSPEQARGLAVDRRSDLFSLGLVMYRALAGEPFYLGGTTAEVFYGAATGPTAEHFERIDRLPAVAARILKQALMPDPADRYATAEDFASDLQPHVSPGAKARVATLLNALFGAELKSGGGIGGTGTLKRDAS